MPQSVTLGMAAEVVAAFVSNTPVPKGELAFPTTMRLIC